MHLRLTDQDVALNDIMRTFTLHEEMLKAKHQMSVLTRYRELGTVGSHGEDPTLGMPLEEPQTGERKPPYHNLRDGTEISKRTRGGEKTLSSKVKHQRENGPTPEP